VVVYVDDLTQQCPGEPGHRASDLGGTFNPEITTTVRRGRDYLNHLRDGRTLRELMVMDPSNDPFNCGTPAHVRDAEWFASIYQAHVDSITRVHLRRIHYRILGVANLPDGRPYENTERCWSYLSNAAKHARTLGLVDARRIEDQRNPKPVLNWEPRLSVEPGWWIHGEPFWEIPRPWFHAPSVKLPEIEVYGYDCEPGDHPVQVELFIEKSTQNDILAPLCRRLNVNLTVGKGYTSHTRIVELVERAKVHGRPVRIICVTDFDPAGHAMPTALARYLQYVQIIEETDLDIAVESVALTAEQCVEFELPREPIKATDNRRGNFEHRFGEGATELDALEALHPGELASIVRKAVGGYRDPDHAVALDATERDAQIRAEEALDASTAEVVTEVKQIHEETREAFRRLHAETEGPIAEYEQTVGPLRDRLSDLRTEYVQLTRDLEVDLPARDVPQAPGLDTDHEWMYRSDRDYLSQLDVFKRHQRRGGAA
jgi:hypothetical protein